MAVVKRKVHNGTVTVLGRRYKLALFGPIEPELEKELERRRIEVEGKIVYVDDDGVCRYDNSKLGVRTNSSVRVYYPRRYDWYFNFILAENDNAEGGSRSQPHVRHGRRRRRRRGAGGEAD